MKRIEILIYLNIILAALLGIYGQDITYYINDHIAKISLSYCLTYLTAISILLFLTTPILIYKYNNLQNIEKKRMNLCQIIYFLVGVPTTLFSLLVLLFWLG